jgi:hypothetical protein
VDADAEFDPLMLRQGGVLLGHAALDHEGTARGVDGAGKLDQHAVTGGLDDAASMSGYRGVDQGFPGGLEPRQRAFLVGSHQPAVTGDIRSQHRCQSPINALFVQ